MIYYPLSVLMLAWIRETGVKETGDGRTGDGRTGGKGNELLELTRKISAMLYNYIKVRKERF